MPIYMKFGEIDGDVTAQGFEKWIEVNSFSWGLTNAIALGGTGGGGGAGKASFQDIHFLTQVSRASPKILSSAASEKPIDTVEFDWIKGEALQRGGGSFLKIKLEDVLVSSYQIGGAEDANGDVPSESIALNFAKIEFDYQTPELDQPIEFVWDVRANQGG